MSADPRTDDGRFVDRHRARLGLFVPVGAPLKDVAVYALAICSPAAMIGIERGNVDLVLLALVLFVCLLGGPFATLPAEIVKLRTRLA